VTATVVYHVRHIALLKRKKKLFADMWSACGEDENHQYLSEIESWLSTPVTI
jgi:hypothetical protein